nr:D-alanyl-D-alanine carboxypeptidase/D-alanyl-D-alanine-endopeptidase [Microbacterium lemovicicum]
MAPHPSSASAASHTLTQARPVRRAAAGLALIVSATLMTSCFGGTAETGVQSGEPATSDLPDAAVQVMEKPEYANAAWHISVSDLDTGSTLIDLAGHVMAEPASFTKSYSVGAAWLRWGPDHTVTTPVKRTGEVTGGVLAGDLVLVGKGDLTLGGRTKADGTVDFANFDHNDANPVPGATLTPEDPLTGLDDLAAQVRASGITSVAGGVTVDDRLFQGQLAGEPITPIIVNQNILDVLITPGQPGAPATVELTPAVAPWQIVSNVTTVAAGADAKVDDPVAGAPGQIVVNGSVAAGSEPQLKTFLLRDPSTFARTAFIEALGRAGVSVAADPLAINDSSTLPAATTVDALPEVAQLVSLPLSEEATYVMKISYNRGAQTLICLLAVDAGKKDCEDGLGVAGQLWADAGLDSDGASLVDGSGLAGNYITAANGVELQRVMAARSDADQWKSTMPILGVDGSLASVQADSPAADKVFAKTGTLVGGDLMNGRTRLNTKALGGVMEAESGRRLAFVIIVNQGFVDGIQGVLAANDDVGAVAAAIQQAY